MSKEKRVMSDKLRDARQEQNEVFKKAWELTKERGLVRPTSQEIVDARKALGLPTHLGARAYDQHGPDTEELVGLSTKGFRIATGTEVVRLLTDGKCSNGHYWHEGSTVYARASKPMCPICGNVIQ